MSAPLSPQWRRFVLSPGALLVLLVLMTVHPAGAVPPAFPAISLVEVTADFPVTRVQPLFPGSVSTAVFADDWFHTPWTYPSDPQVLHRHGLGLLIDPRGYVMTSQHLVGYPGDHQKISVEILATADARALAREGHTSTGRLVAADPSRDLALLLLDEPPGYGQDPGVPPLAPAPYPPLEIGSPINLLAETSISADTLGYALIPGQVTRYAKWPSPDPTESARLLDPILGESREVAGLIPVRLTTPTTAVAPAARTLPLPGTPAFDATGRVVGLVTGLQSTTDPDLAFIIPLQAGLELLSRFTDG